jgi:hypothetical protein
VLRDRTGIGTRTRLRSLRFAANAAAAVTMAATATITTAVISATNSAMEVASPFGKRSDFSARAELLVFNSYRYSIVEKKGLEIHIIVNGMLTA